MSFMVGTYAPGRQIKFLLVFWHPGAYALGNLFLFLNIVLVN
jgi:hypothetical protein